MIRAGVTSDEYSKTSWVTCFVFKLPLPQFTPQNRARLPAYSVNKMSATCNSYDEEASQTNTSVLLQTPWASSQGFNVTYACFLVHCFVNPHNHVCDSYHVVSQSAGLYKDGEFSFYENFHSSAPSYHSSHNPTTQSNYIVLLNAQHGPPSHHCYRALCWRKQRCCFVLPVPLRRWQPLLRYCKSSCITSHSSLTCSQLWCF